MRKPPTQNLHWSEGFAPTYMVIRVLGVPLLLETLEYLNTCHRYLLGIFFTNLTKRNITWKSINIFVCKTFLGQQEKLKTALTCVGNAEKTVENYKDFLKTEKYKEWNEQQNKKQEDHVKEMIGEFIVKKTFLFKIRC